MVEIIPSINVRTFEEATERIKKVEPYVRWCHLDVTDGIFSKHLTWHDPRGLLNLETSLNVEVHLMVVEPERIIEQWLVRPVKRVIIHLEASKDLDLVIQKCREAGIEIGLALKPETFWGKLKPWFGPVRSPMRSYIGRRHRRLTSNGVDMFTVLAVHPGPSGQQIAENTFEKIAHIRKSCPGCIIELDGGINPDTAKKAVESGANLLVAGNFIFGSADIKQAVEILRGSTS